jgi:hypothetical protein
LNQLVAVCLATAGSSFTRGMMSQPSGARRVSLSGSNESEYAAEDAVDGIGRDPGLEAPSKVQSQAEIDALAVVLFHKMKLHFRGEYQSKVLVFLDCLQVRTILFFLNESDNLSVITNAFSALNWVSLIRAHMYPFFNAFLQISLSCTKIFLQYPISRVSLMKVTSVCAIPSQTAAILRAHLMGMGTVMSRKRVAAAQALIAMITAPISTSASLLVAAMGMKWTVTLAVSTAIMQPIHAPRSRKQAKLGCLLRNCKTCDMMFMCFCKEYKL